MLPYQDSRSDLAFSFIPLPFRPPKPREYGLTMVLDKGLTLTEARELAEMAGAYIDIVKLGWGTTRLLSRAHVAAKIDAYKAHQIKVSPGGTFLEVAAAHGLETDYLTEARALGFTCIEVSDGVFRMDGRKIDLIRRARDLGFVVLSEVGRKSPAEDARLDVAMRVAESRHELAAGAWKVIMEGRESGTVGVFTGDGTVRSTVVDALVSEVGLHSLVFEAPTRAQQAWFISNCGNDVNLGNIAPADTISVETLRTGLRGDTLLQHHAAPTSVSISLGPDGALAAARRGDVVVVIDALRASSTIVTALAHGVRAVAPVTSVDDCVGELTAGERGGRKVAGLSHDNSPRAFATSIHTGKELVLTTTNGTECIRAAAAAPEPRVLIGCLLNARAVATQAYRIARDEERNVTLLLAGRNNRMAVEDLIAATEIAAYLPHCRVRGTIEPLNSDDFVRDFLQSESGANLVALGCRDDVVFCARKDVYEVAPQWRDGLLVPSSPPLVSASPAHGSAVAAG